MKRSRIVVVAGLPDSLLNFRGDLLAAMVAAGHEVTAMAAPAAPAVISRLADLRVAFRPFPLQRSGLNPFRDLQTYLALRRTLRELQPDVVLCYTIKPVIWGGLAVKGIPGARFYALITGLGFAFQGSGLRRRLLMRLVAGLYRAAVATASGVIFQNRNDRDVFVARGIATAPQCSVVNGSGVDLARFSVAPFPKTGAVFLTIGRVLGEKGFREYAEAARRVREVHPDAVFRLAGPVDPSPDGISMAEVSEWQDRGSIEYLGETNDVRAFLADAHVFVLPSYHEGMPRTVLEALATGRPILTTDVPGCRETVIPGENGALVPKGDAAALTDKILWFIEHRNEWPRMGARSRLLAEQRFDVRTVNSELMNIMRLAR